MKSLLSRWGGRLVASVLLGFALVGCKTVGETGRRQFNIISPSQEVQLGLSAFQEMKQEIPVSKDAQANAMLQRVGQRIAAVADLPNAQWEFVLFDSEEMNAFCLPGGKVGIYTGILAITKDEEGLAAVVGHEVAHAALHHGAERMSHALVLQTGGQVVGAAMSESDPKVSAAAQTIYGLGSTVGLALPHNRMQESEADRVGLRYMARAGYNPDAAVGFWERFAEYNRKAGAGTPWFLRTHPVDEKRIQQIKQWLPEARAQYQQQPQ